MMLQARPNTTDEAGQPSGTWSTVRDIWTNPRGSTGMGVVRGRAEGITVDVTVYSFRTRYNRDITSAHRLLDPVDGSIFDIKTVHHDLERREWTDMVCEYGGNDG